MRQYHSLVDTGQLSSRWLAHLSVAGGHLFEAPIRLPRAGQSFVPGSGNSGEEVGRLRDTKPQTLTR